MVSPKQKPSLAMGKAETFVWFALCDLLFAVDSLKDCIQKANQKPKLLRNG